MKSVILLLRPHQWLKNVFVFLPLFFDGKMMQMAYLVHSIVIFVAYCLAASGIYCFNDIYDVEADRQHPEKCRRPIASGAVSKVMGYLLMTLCFAASFGITSLYDWQNGNDTALTGVIAFYVAMNIAYCVKLKQIAVVDVFTIAVGFVLRLLAGGLATGIWLSHWIVLMTFLLALFLALAKRRDDVIIYESTGMKARKNVNRYNLEFMNQSITIVGSIAVVCYIMYTVTPEVMKRSHSSFIYTTVVFVLAGFVRYMQITIVDVKSGSPTKVLMKDRFIQACIAGWILAFATIIYM